MLQSIAVVFSFHKLLQWFPHFLLWHCNGFHWIGPLGRFSLRVAMSVCVCVFAPLYVVLLVYVLLSALVEGFSVSRMRNFSTTYCDGAMIPPHILLVRCNFLSTTYFYGTTVPPQPIMSVQWFHNHPDVTLQWFLHSLPRRCNNIP